MNVQELSFDANFESGNLASTERLDETEYNVFIRPDLTINVRFWFYFRVSNVTPGLPYIFHILSFSKGRTTFATEQTPLVRSTSRNRWERVPRSSCFYYVSGKHRCYTANALLSVLFQFDRDEDYFFAFSYPFTYSMLTKFNARLVAHKLPYVLTCVLGKTFAGNDFPVILIGQDIHDICTGKPGYQRRLVWVSARVHSGEVPSSYILHGLLEFLISNNPMAKYLRERVVFLLLPMINIDGVIAGYYRGSAAGVDLNRTYDAPDPKLHPETYMMRSLFQELVRAGNTQPYQALGTPGGMTNAPLDSPVPSDFLFSNVEPGKLEAVFETNELSRALLRQSIALDLYTATETGLLRDPSSSSRPQSDSQTAIDGDSSFEGELTEKSALSGMSSVETPYPELQGTLEAPDFLPSGRTKSSRPPQQPTQQQPTQQSTQQQQQQQPPPPPPKPTCSFPPEIVNLISQGYSLDFVLDLHSHSNLAGGFLFVNPDTGVFNRSKRASCELVFPVMLAQNCQAFGALDKSFKSSKDRREGSLRRALMNLAKGHAYDNAPYVYCLEVSNSHGPDPAKAGKIQKLRLISNELVESDELSTTVNCDDAERILYTPASWMKIGEKVCCTLNDVYRLLE